MTSDRAGTTSSARLRQLVARAAVDHLEPDLVILDEFQRFKGLLDGDDEGARLANAIFDHPDAKVLLLSATPYKMYTLPDEPEGDDHYRDFTRTIRFLAGDERAHIVERELRTMREGLLTGGDHTRAREARDQVEHELRRVMSRTERLSLTPDRNGMLAERPLPGVQLTAEDLRSWRTFDDIARQIERARRLRVLALDAVSAQPHGAQQLSGAHQVRSEQRKQTTPLSARCSSKHEDCSTGKRSAGTTRSIPATPRCADLPTTCSTGARGN